MAVQNVGRLGNVHAVDPTDQKCPSLLDRFVLLPDRNRALYMYKYQPLYSWHMRSELKLLDLSVTSLEAVSSEEGLASCNNVIRVDQSDEDLYNCNYVTAITVSGDGLSVVLGTSEGTVSVYEAGFRHWRDHLPGRFLRRAEAS